VQVTVAFAHEAVCAARLQQWPELFKCPLTPVSQAFQLHPLTLIVKGRADVCKILHHPAMHTIRKTIVRGNGSHSDPGMDGTYQGSYFVDTVGGQFTALRHIAEQTGLRELAHPDCIFKRHIAPVQYRSID
jgi:hypothetical protein